MLGLCKDHSTVVSRGQFNNCKFVRQQNHGKIHQACLDSRYRDIPFQTNARNNEL